MAGATSTEYIKHHLQNLTFGKLPDGSWGFAQTIDQAQSMGFWAVHVDSMFWSLFLGGFFLWLFRRFAKTASASNPNRFGHFIEMVIEFIDTSVKDNFHGKSSFIPPLSLTIFCVGFFDEFNGLSPS